MNKARRKSLRDIHDSLTGLKDRLEDVMCKEQEAFDNLTESLKCTQRGQEMEGYIDALDNAISDLEYLCSDVDDSTSGAV
jgi:formiminotetrahydrofolate cyclodeaminase